MRDPPLFLFLFDCPDGGYEQYRMYCKYLYITFSSAARRPCILVWAMVIISLAETGAVQAQTEKTVQGQHDPTPYISYAEFRDISASKGQRTISSKSLRDTTNLARGGQVVLQELLSVSSLDEVIRILGQPKAIDRDEFPDGGWAATLQYEGGTMFDYQKFEDGTIALLELQLWSSDWSLKVGEKELRPGMRIDSLSSVVRQSIQEGSYPKGANVDGIGSIHIAKPGTAKGGNVTLLKNGKAEITVHVNTESGTVGVVRFARLGPW